MFPYFILQMLHFQWNIGMLNITCTSHGETGVHKIASVVQKQETMSVEDTSYIARGVMCKAAFLPHEISM